MTNDNRQVRPYTELLLDPSNDPREVAGLLAGFGADLAGEADDLVDMLDESRSPDFLCSVVALFTAIGPSEEAYRRFLSRLDDFAARAGDRLRVLWAIATWNSGQDDDIAILMMKKIVSEWGQPLPTSGSTYDQLAAWQVRRDRERQLELSSFPWRLRTSEADIFPENFLEFYQLLARIIGAHVVADRLEQPFESSIDLIEAIVESLGRLTDEEEQARPALVRLLARAGVDDAEAIPRLAPLLRNPDNGVREAAIRALGRVRAGAADATPLLAKALGDRSGEVRAAAATGLGALGQSTPEVTAALVRCLVSPVGAQAMEDAADALNRLGHPGDHVPAEAVLKHLSNKKIWMRKAAARSCGLLGLRHPSAVAALKEALKDPKEIVRAYAAVSLWTLTGATEEILPRLLDGLRYRTDDPDMVKTMGLHVFNTLEQMAIAGDARARTAIEGHLDHPDHWMRASRALWRVGSSLENRSEFTRDFVSRLVKRLEQGCYGAAILLGELGHDAEDARSALERGAQSPSPRLRHWSCKALRLIVRSAGDP